MAQRQRTARTRTGTKKPSRTRSSKKSTESNESFDIVTRNLAAQYRPKVLEDYVGQESKVGLSPKLSLKLFSFTVKLVLAKQRLQCLSPVT